MHLTCLEAQNGNSRGVLAPGYLLYVGEMSRELWVLKPSKMTVMGVLAVSTCTEPLEGQDQAEQ